MLDKVYIYDEISGAWKSLNLISKERRYKITESINKIINETIDNEIEKLKEDNLDN
ncbi:hypothetical protein [Natranaerofaba carboxydovora]|uniref:hypothetical protein n=1 Tax=Natranaerofaba carboxydovora TaxID=2742683 RepID=UPI001F13CB36|nr:hypothetical protein [Natranaerofaba carboxydovora]UMZ73534.1 hypothetical protein ACONDI_01088 [Natranaerofaba carboxydovora]